MMSRRQGRQILRAVTSLVLVGQYRDKHYLMEVNGAPLWLRGTGFRYLFHLAAARGRSIDGWINKQDIEPGPNQNRYVYRLRAALVDAGLDGYTLIENNSRSYYRLAIPATAITFDTATLADFPDVIVRNTVRLLATRRTGVAR